MRKLSRDLLLRLFQERPAAEHDVVAVLVELDDLGLHGLADVRSEITNTTQLDERCRQEATQTDVDDETALDDLDHRTLDHAVGFLDLLDRAPRPLVLRPLLGQQQPAFLVLLLEDQGFDLLAELDDLVRVDIVADAQLAGEDDAFALVADVEQHFVLVDLDDRTEHQLAVFDFDHRAFDGVGEGHAQVVVDDLAGLVIPFLVEGAHGTAGYGEGRGIGQRTIAFE